MKVLLVRAGALGDLLLLRRGIAELRSAGHLVRLLAPAAGAALVGPGIGEVDALFPWDAPETAALLAGGGAVDGPLTEVLGSADVIVAWTRRDDVLRALVAAARRVIAHDPAPPPGGEHASLWLARALEPLGLETVAEPPPLSFTPAERVEADRRVAGLPSGFLAIHPGSGSLAKNWPGARFFELAERLSVTTAREPRFLLSVGPAELERGIEVPPAALVAREWPLRVLGAAFARAGLFVGNDSGASHLAAAAGAPTLALFGPTEPAMWSPVGPRVLALRAPGGVLPALTVDAVLRAADRLRSAASEPPSAR